MSRILAAVDLGASSGRVIAGVLTDGRFDLRETVRFPNRPYRLPTPQGDRLHWGVLGMWGSILEGLRTAARDLGPIESIGIDTWAVDYGLLDANGELIGNPASYRCARTRPEQFFEAMPVEELFELVGLQIQPFNTVFQLAVESQERLQIAQRILLMPDLLGYWLTGRPVAEVTNASTTGLLDPVTRRWQPTVLDVVGCQFARPIEHLLPELVEPGTVVGPVIAPDLDLHNAAGEPTQLVAVGTHDTASAIVAVPAERDDFAYISCGTWSLVGLELPEPVLTPAAREANLTNELGVDGTVRFLKNVMGLWVFNECLATWRNAGHELAVADLVAAAAAAEPLRTIVDINDAAFFPPGDMPGRIAECATRTGQPAPRNEAETARCVFDSLALAYRQAVRQVADVAGRDVGVVHMLGGGIQNRLLCQLTADATGLPVVAGPVEGTALGNLVVQARAVGLLDGGLSELRQVVRASSHLVNYTPGPTDGCWDAAERRVWG
ncbi:rhamnulokinase [Tessaracoccus flavescens]|uniref:Rhamnulokinase n=1 Tax=Tessaracoccus flavescens TaxID=399497 RepID=A0A1Q2CVG5_9ACTN|nr:rhamnulokinase family protein [Tessaracoccus flavescens]AQP50091.1 rhamnulokinase [Tessaracoccus flavescens]